MTREEYIRAVKVKLEELTTFESPQSFEVSDDVSIKPIEAYIENELDNATKYCLCTLPVSFLSADILHKKVKISVNNEGVGFLKEDALLFIRPTLLSCYNHFAHDIQVFDTISSVNYILEKNYSTRSGYSKPHCYINPNTKKIEIYSFYDVRGRDLQDRDDDENYLLYYINTTKAAEAVLSNIDSFIILQCAYLVLMIFGDNKADSIKKEFIEQITIWQQKI